MSGLPPPTPDEAAAVSSTVHGPKETAKIEEYARILETLTAELRKRIIGQDEVVKQVLASIFAEGHCLIVGVPGLAKTLLIRSIAELLSLEFKRIQFTPDLMPSDITGATLIRDDSVGERGFHFLRGPIFANVILADEINRTPPKTQSALMEAMEERQITTGGKRRPLDRPFFVLATQNPIEQEGTYPLPVSQLDRFLFEINIDYPSEDEEFRIVLLTTTAYNAELGRLLSREQILEIIALIRRMALPEKLVSYASRVVRSTRPSSKEAPEFVREWISWGAGPRAVQALLLGAKSLAFLAGRTEPRLEDLQAIVHPTLRHRLVLSYHAEAEGVKPDNVIDKVLESQPEGFAPPRLRKQAQRKGLLSRVFGSQRDK